MKTRRMTVSDLKNGGLNNEGYKLPKFLFKGELKRKLTNDARVLYMLLLEEGNSLESRNNLINEDKKAHLLLKKHNLVNEKGEII